MFGRLDTYDDSQASTNIAANDVKYGMLSLWRSLVNIRMTRLTIVGNESSLSRSLHVKTSFVDFEKYHVLQN
jgi:hypothetical protein